MNNTLPPRALASLKRKFQRRLPAFYVAQVSCNRFQDFQSMEYIEDGLPAGGDAGYFGVPSAKLSAESEESSVGCFEDCYIVPEEEDEDLMTSSAITRLPKPKSNNKAAEDHDCFEDLITSARDYGNPSVLTLPSSSSTKSKSFPKSGPSSFTERVNNPTEGNDTNPKQNDSFTVLNELIDEDYFSTLEPASKPIQEAFYPDTRAIQKRLRTIQKPEEFIANMIPKTTKQNAKRYQGT